MVTFTTVRLRCAIARLARCCPCLDGGMDEPTLTVDVAIIDYYNGITQEVVEEAVCFPHLVALLDTDEQQHVTWLN